ncbi:hypothetical protein GPX89_27855 [Nocardia sp. ET3-3]|uniref:Lipid/polyisoprenoid-binding YceI-like domain-containing protein n=1 Tax=Nocardia terrae TaxID=2675851 RepID=A0A7K1V3M9_9NOCA|nr:YceI family protein [Nocardia terrae]MVU81049.1 hypothetical protein [Nocardia terrae]
MTTSTAITLAPGHWTLDATQSSIGFTVRKLGLFRVNGEFQRFDTEFVVDDSGAAAIEATVHLASFKTKSAKRDEHVRNADFLDVENRPTMTFRAPAPVRIGESFDVTGQVTYAGQTHPLTLTTTWNGLRPHAVTGRNSIGFTATGSFDRTAFGVGPNSGGLIGKLLTVTLGVQLIEPV